MQKQIKWEKNGPIATAAYTLFDVGNLPLEQYTLPLFLLLFTTTIAPENGTTYWGCDICCH